MIDIITDALLSILKGIISLFPSFDFSFLPYSDVLNNFSNFLKTLNYYLPISEIFFIINLVLAFYSFRLIYRVFLWIASRFVI